MTRSGSSCAAEVACRIVLSFSFCVSIRKLKSLVTMRVFRLLGESALALWKKVWRLHEEIWRGRSTGGKQIHPTSAPVDHGRRWTQVRSRREAGEVIRTSSFDRGVYTSLKPRA